MQQFRDLVLVRIPVKDRVGADAGKIGLLKKSTYGTRDAPGIPGSVIGKNVSKAAVFSLGSARRICFVDDPLLSGPTERLREFVNKMTGCI